MTLGARNSCGTAEGISYGEACRQLEEAGADVVGLNCARGPDTILPLMKEVRSICKVQLSFLTHQECFNF